MTSSRERMSDETVAVVSRGGIGTFWQRRPPVRTRLPVGDAGCGRRIALARFCNAEEEEDAAGRQFFFLDFRGGGGGYRKSTTFESSVRVASLHYHCTAVFSLLARNTCFRTTHDVARFQEINRFILKVGWWFYNTRPIFLRWLH